MECKSILKVLLLTLVSTASFSQVFEKEKVIVWEVIDEELNVKVLPSVKQVISDNITNTILTSRKYELYSCEIGDVKQYINDRGFNMTPGSISRALRELYNIDYVILVNLLSPTSDTSNFLEELRIESALLDIKAKEIKRSAYIDVKSDIESIDVGSSRLSGYLLDEPVVVSSQIRGKNYTEKAKCRLGIKMIYVDAEFIPVLSESKLRDKDATMVAIVEPYYIAENAITPEQWHKIMGTTFEEQYLKMLSYAYEGNNPITSYHTCKPTASMTYISFDDAQEFCKRLSKISGKNYTLPTEGQWGYAAYCNFPNFEIGSIWEWCSNHSYTLNDINTTFSKSGKNRTKICMLCGGDRDPHKRIYKVSSLYADVGFRVVCIP